MSTDSSSDSEGEVGDPAARGKAEAGPGSRSGGKEKAGGGLQKQAHPPAAGGDRQSTGKKKTKKKGKGKKKSYGGGGGGGGGGARSSPLSSPSAGATGQPGGRAASLAERIGDVSPRAPGGSAAGGGGSGAAAVPPAEQAPFPFTAAGAGVQKRMKDQYDLLVKANVEKTLTLDQVGRFVTLLVDVKKTLVAKSEQIQRKFQIAKSLLSKADKQSCDRLCKEIYRLENEQKKLESDTDVYNRMQEQLKQSPAYASMLEYGRTHFELSEGTGQLVERFEEGPTFEQLLAEEKEQGLWKGSSITGPGAKTGVGILKGPGGHKGGSREEEEEEEEELSFEALLAQEKAAGGL